MNHASIPERLLLGPGPSPVPQRVLQAMASPVIGHLDPAFLGVIDETMGLLRGVFLTANNLTIPISGTGSGGMEAAVMNLVEPGTRIVVVTAGYFGERIASHTKRGSNPGGRGTGPALRCCGKAWRNWASTRSSPLNSARQR